jgi:uncharacterized RDD family membrane protein YckC
MAYPVQTDPTAVFGRRVLAALIDGLLILVPVILLITAQFEYLDVDSLPVSAEQFCDSYNDERDGICVDLSDTNDRVYFSDGAGGSAWPVYWGATFGMFVVLQGLTGWSIGKLLVGIRVVKEDGSTVGVVKALVRWLLWVVDAFPYFLPLVGFIVGLTTAGHRRVGDMVAKTFVVRSSAAGSPIVVPGLTASPPVGSAGAWGVPPPTGWGSAVDPNAAGWAAPAAPAAPPTAPTAPAANAPQWDAARGTYIQWDATQGAWVQWDEGLKTWSRIPGQ